MKAIAIKEFGATKNFFEEQRDIPNPGPDEVLMRIRAGSFNPIDYKIRQGRFGGNLPMVLGHDAAGVIARSWEQCQPAANWRRSLGLPWRPMQQRRVCRICLRAPRICHSEASHIVCSKNPLPCRWLD